MLSSKDYHAGEPNWRALGAGVGYRPPSQLRTPGPRARHRRRSHPARGRRVGPESIRDDRRRTAHALRLAVAPAHARVISAVHLPVTSALASRAALTHTIAHADGPPTSLAHDVARRRRPLRLRRRHRGNLHHAGQRVECRVEHVLLRRRLRASAPACSATARSSRSPRGRTRAETAAVIALARRAAQYRCSVESPAVRRAPGEQGLPRSTRP